MADILCEARLGPSEGNGFPGTHDGQSFGQKVATLVDEEQAAAYHEVRVDAGRLVSGIYFYRIHARRADGGQEGNFVQVRKFILMK